MHKTANNNMNGIGGGFGAGASHNNRSGTGHGVIPVRQPLNQPVEFQKVNFGRFRNSADSDSSFIPLLTRRNDQQPRQPPNSLNSTVDHDFDTNESNWNDTEWSDTDRSGTGQTSLQSSQLNTPSKLNVDKAPPLHKNPEDHAPTPRIPDPVSRSVNNTTHADPTSFQGTQLNTPSKSNVYKVPALRKNPEDCALTPRSAGPVGQAASHTSNTDPTFFQGTQLDIPSKSNVYIPQFPHKSPRDHALTPRYPGPLNPRTLYYPMHDVDISPERTTNQGAQQVILQRPGEAPLFASQCGIGIPQPRKLSYATAAALPAPSQPPPQVHGPGEPLVLPKLTTMSPSEKASRINEGQPGRDDPGYQLGKKLNGFRDGYRGDPFNDTNIPCNVANEENCSLRITGLSAACTFAQLERALGSSYGSIFAMDLKQPEGYWITSAADLVFMHREPAERLLRDTKYSGWLVGGHRAVVGWNRNRVAASPESDLRGRPISRCLQISGPGEVVNATSLKGMFVRHFWWRTSAIDTVYKNTITGYTIMEWRFCRVSGQADMAARCIMKLKQENPGKYSNVQWQFIEDPCGANAPKNPTPPQLASFLAHKEKGNERRPSAVDEEVSRGKGRESLEQGSGTKPHWRSGRQWGGQSSSFARAGQESWRP